MKEAMQSVRKLYGEGKLQRKLITRIVLLALATILTAGVVLVDILWRHLPALPSFLFVIPGFLFGFFIMSKIFSVHWDEYQEIITIGRFDIASFLILAAYIVVRIKTSEYIGDRYSDTFHISGYTLATFFGIIFGRLLGVTKRIHRVSLGEEMKRL